MQKGEMQERIKSELERIPRGRPLDNRLRAVYEIRREHGLRANPDQLPAEPFRQAVDDVRKEDPKFSPKFRDPQSDAEYFDWRE